jgi:hypothetical protein
MEKIRASQNKNRDFEKELWRFWKKSKWGKWRAKRYNLDFEKEK